MLENSLCWIKFLIFQCPLKKIIIKKKIPNCSYQPQFYGFVFCLFLSLFVSLICCYRVGRDTRKGFINTMKRADSSSHPEPSI